MPDQNTLFIVGAGVAAGFIVIGFFVFDLWRKWRELFGNAGTRDELLTALAKEQKEHSVLLSRHEARLKVLEAIADISVQKIGFIRFNPFSETGGNNSFALTLLDRHDNGVIISSLYTREGVRVYGKAIIGGASKHPLSQEEKQSLAQALKTQT